MAIPKEYYQYIISPENSYHSFSINQDELSGDTIWKPKGFWVFDTLGSFHRAVRGQPRSMLRKHYNDYPENWDMTLAGKTRGYYFWNGGYINDRCKKEEQSYEQYWWCRSSDWMPIWGNITIQKANLMINIRSYWREKWFENEVPKIKKALEESTPLVQDTINIIEKFLIYPYQIKSFN